MSAKPRKTLEQMTTERDWFRVKFEQSVREHDESRAQLAERDALCQEGAEEILRLRAQLTELQSEIDSTVDILMRRDAEIERLNAWILHDCDRAPMTKPEPT